MSKLEEQVQGELALMVASIMRQLPGCPSIYETAWKIIHANPPSNEPKTLSGSDMSTLCAAAIVGLTLARGVFATIETKPERPTETRDVN